MAVSNAIKEGRIAPPAVIYVDNQPKIADVALADQQWARNTDPVRAANGVQARTVTPLPPAAPVVGEESAQSATERLKSAQADLAELKRDEMAGELVRASDVRKRLEEYIAACKTRLLAIPSRARQALPHLVNADVLEIENLVREALEELVGVAA